MSCNFNGRLYRSRGLHGNIYIKLVKLVPFEVIDNTILPNQSTMIRITIAGVLNIILRP